MKKLLGLILVLSLSVSSMAMAKGNLNFDDSGFDYDNEDLSTAYVNLSYDEGALIVVFADQDMGSNLPVVDVKDEIPSEISVYDADLAADFEAVDLDYRAKTFQAVSFTHEDVTLADVEARYDAILSDLGFKATPEQTSGSSLITVYEKDNEQLRLIFTRHGNDAIVRIIAS